LAELIVDLAVHGGSANRSALQARLFPDVDQRRAGNHFRQVLFKLRELVGVSLERPNPNTVAWPAQYPLTSSDVEFERVATAFLNDDHTREPEELRAAIDSAVGGFLPASDLPWVEERRNVLNVLYEESVIVMLRAASARGDLDIVRHYGRRATAVNPYSEDLYLLMMKAEQAHGSPTRSRAIYREAVAALDDLGLEPSAELRRLAQRLGASVTEPAGSNR
jgi:DNA-binding SARP family transcriptional activator